MRRKLKADNFFGIPQHNLKGNSSIALNGTEKQKVPERDQTHKTLHEVYKHYEDSVRVSSCPFRQSHTCDICQHSSKSSKFSTKEHTSEIPKNTTKQLSESQRISLGISNDDRENCIQPNEISAERKSFTQANDTTDLQDLTQGTTQKKKSKFDIRVNTAANNEYDCKVRKHRSLDTGTQTCSDQSCQCTPPSSGDRKKNRRLRRNTDINNNEYPTPDNGSNAHKEKKRKSNHRKHYDQETAIENKHSKRKIKQHHPQIDQIFMEDVIKKQTKEIFDKGQSDLSQISAPVCRDYETSLSEPTPDLYLCGCEPRSLPPTHSYDYKSHEKSRSAYDTHFLPSHRLRSHSQYLYVDPYCDVDLYDMVPVKENSHPKSRRKYVNNSIGCDVYRDVPPSPRTYRPRFNLEAQIHADYKECLKPEPANEYITPKRLHQNRTEYNTHESETTSVTTHRETCLIAAKTQTSVKQSCPLLSRFNYSAVGNGPEAHRINDESQNSKNIDNVDTTDKSLSELRDILQNFLEEIKKKPVERDNAMDSTNKEQSKEVIRSGTGNTNYAMNTSHVFMPNNRTPLIMPSITLQTPLPNTTGTMPNTTGAMPNTTGAMPNTTGAVPNTTAAIPNTIGAMHITKVTIPNITGAVPNTTGSMPNTRGAMPCMAEPLPPSDSRMNCPLPSILPEPQNTCAFNPYEVPLCTVPPHLQPFRTCCYSSVPVCPCAVSTICGCHSHYTASNNVCQYCSNKMESKFDMDRNTETEDMIKEIYKIVTLNPIQTDQDNAKKKANLTSRSVGGSLNGMPRHDFNGGIYQQRNYSKSCEAIGSQNVTQGSYATRSDTLLENLNLDMTQSEAEFPEIFRKRDTQSKKKKTFTDVIKSLFRKKKSVVTDTTPESYYVKTNKEKASFRQQVTDYMMTGQEYFQPRSARPPHRYQCCECCNQNPKHSSPHASRVFRPQRYFPETSSSRIIPQELHRKTIPEYEATYDPQGYYEPTHGPQGYSWYGLPPYLYPAKRYHDFQVPLCLREIEVKSTGTQSEKKLSFLNKLGRRGHKVSHPSRTKSKVSESCHSKKFRKPKSNWQKFQENVQKDINYQMTNGFKQRNTMGNNKKLRNKILKKMFYKKNSLSPSNLIIRTLLGND